MASIRLRTPRSRPPRAHIPQTESAQLCGPLRPRPADPESPSPRSSRAAAHARARTRSLPVFGSGCGVCSVSHRGLKGRVDASARDPRAGYQRPAPRDPPAVSGRQIGCRPRAWIAAVLTGRMQARAGTGPRGSGSAGSRRSPTDRPTSSTVRCWPPRSLRRRPARGVQGRRPPAMLLPGQRAHRFGRRTPFRGRPFDLRRSVRHEPDEGPPVSAPRPTLVARSCATTGSP